MTHAFRVAALAATLLGPGAGCARAQGQSADDAIERLGWLAGCWERRTGDALLEEQWMTPRGGTMLGMSRDTRAERVVGHEFARIEERAGALVFIAQPSGQTAVEFASTGLDAAAVVFENPAHDFPRRITYRHAAGDSLHARIEGPGENDAIQGIDFRMGRVACTS